MLKCTHKKKHYLGTTAARGMTEVLYSCPRCGMISSEVEDVSIAEKQHELQEVTV